MTVEAIKGEVVYTCDTCENTLETGERDFVSANRVRQDEGWTARRENGDWHHYCSRACEMRFD